MEQSDLRLLWRLLSACKLEEAWFNVSLPNLAEALERQDGLVNLTITGPNSIKLSRFTNLTKLIVNGLTESMVDQINSHGQKLQLLKLIGSADLIDRVSMDSLPFIHRLSAELASPLSEEALQRRAGREARSVLAGSITISLALNSTWTNTTLSSTVCSYSTSAVDSLTLTDANKLYFVLPTCVSTWTSLTTLALTGIIRPDFVALPLTLTNLQVIGLIGPTITYDWDYMARLSDLKSLYIGSSGLTGTFPSNTTIASFNILDGMVGEIPSDFFLLSPNLTTFSVRGLQVTGDLPSYGYKNLQVLSCSNSGITGWGPLNYSTAIPGNGPPLALEAVAIDNNPLLSFLPDTASFAAMEKLTTFRVSSAPLLTGPLPLYNNPSILGQLIQYGVPRCSFNGSLPALPSRTLKALDVGLDFDVSDNKLSGTIPSSWSNYPFKSINLGGLKDINGDWPEMWKFAKRTVPTPPPADVFLGGLDLTSTSLTGRFNLDPGLYYPSFFPDSRQPYFYFDGTLIDFCSAAMSSSTSNWNFTASDCVMTNTNANKCTARYAAAGCTFSPLSCPLPAPSADFYCNNGVWTSNTSVTTPTFTVPPNLPVVIEGNLTSSTVIFNSINSSITVSGCVDGLKLVTLNLTQEDIEKLQKSPGKSILQTLLRFGSPGSNTSCSTLSSTQISIAKQPDSCQKVKVDKAKSSSNSALVAVFTLDRSQCNLWWIILVPVVCGLVVIAVIVTIVVVLHLKSKTMGPYKPQA